VDYQTVNPRHHPQKPPRSLLGPPLRLLHAEPDIPQQHTLCRQSEVGNASSLSIPKSSSHKHNADSSAADDDFDLGLCQLNRRKFRSASISSSISIGSRIAAAFCGATTSGHSCGPKEMAILPPKPPFGNAIRAITAGRRRDKNRDLNHSLNRSHVDRPGSDHRPISMNNKKADTHIMLNNPPTTCLIQPPLDDLLMDSKSALVRHSITATMQTLMQRVRALLRKPDSIKGMW